MSKRDLERLPKEWDISAAVAWADGRRIDAVNAVLKLLNAAGDNKPKALVVQIGYYLFLLHDFAGAATVLQHGVSQNPDDTELRMNLAACLNRSQQHDKAVVELEILSKQTPYNPSVFDGLAHAHYQLRRLDAARAAGTRALELKDAACEKVVVEWKLPDTEPATQTAGKQSVMSFSLWGNNPRYLRGAIDNAMQIARIYPGWTARFYIDHSVPQTVTSALRQLGAEVHLQPSAADDFERLCWRFHVSDDPTVGYFLVRDADSVINERERLAVLAWQQSGRWFHVMRDWWTHTDLMLAGMWGGVAGILPPMAKMLEHYRPAWLQTPNMDQWFLRDRVWTYVRHNCLVHDRCFSPPGAVKWPGLDPLGTFHVGQNVHAVAARKQSERLKDWIARLPDLQE